MKLRIFPACLMALAGLSILFTGCLPHTHGGGPHGPPPHAPAHGYRYHYDGVELVYDSGLGVYAVVGYPDYYFYDGYYFRVYDGRWQMSGSLERDWNEAPGRNVPPGLAKKKGKGREKGKHDDHPGKGKGKGWKKKH